MKRPLHSQEHWVHTWTAAPQLTEPDNLPPKPITQDAVVFADTTIRQTVKITLGSSKRLRLRISNAFGSQPLTITETTIALAANGQSGTSAIQPGSLQQVTFNGSKAVIVSSGAQAVSDAIELRSRLPARTVLSVSLFLEKGQLRASGVTSHPGSRTTSYFARGNHVEQIDVGDGSVEQADHWYYISGVEVSSSHREARAIALIGDSITDGRCSTTNGDTRWPDLLFTRIQAHPLAKHQPIALVNQAAGGNRILEDGLGANVLSRLDRDILSISGVECVMIFEGVNDIGVCAAEHTAQEELADRLIAAYSQIAMRVRARRIPIFAAATITPFGRPTISSTAQGGDVNIIDANAGANLAEEDENEISATGTSYSHPIREKTRQKVNDWIRTSGVFDCVVDFDLVLRDPGRPSCLAQEFDSGDHLHPNERAFQMLADAVPIEMLCGVE